MATRSQQLNRSLNKFVALHFRPFAAMTSALVLIVGYLVFLNPKVSEIRKVGFFDLQRSRNQLELKQYILEATKSLTKKYNDLNVQNTTALASFLPKEPDLPALFVQTEALAIAAGLQMENVNFSLPTQVGSQGQPASANTERSATTAVQPAANTTAGSSVVASNGTTAIKQLSVTFTASGGRGYSDLKKFLTTVESNSRLFDVQSLTYTPPQKDQTESYLINAVTYYLAR